jgi:hypothetical protein
MIRNSWHFAPFGRIARGYPFQERKKSLLRMVALIVKTFAIKMIGLGAFIARDRKRAAA